MAPDEKHWNNHVREGNILSIYRLHVSKLITQKHKQQNKVFILSQTVPRL